MVSLSERLGRFAARAHAAGCDVEIHHATRGLVAAVTKGESADGAELELIATDHAAALHGRQGYELQAVYPEGGIKQKLPFRVAGEASEADGLQEPGTEKGVVATQAKQIDRLLTALERQQKPLTDALETLGKMLAQYQTQQGDMFKQQLEIASMTAERDAEKRRDELAAKKWESLTARLGPVVDAIAVKFGLPPAGGRDDVLLKFAESLDDAQKAVIVRTLRPDQVLMMQARQYGALMASLLESGQIEALLPHLRGEQLALLDAAAGLPKANGASASAVP